MSSIQSGRKIVSDWEKERADEGFSQHPRRWTLSAHCDAPAVVSTEEIPGHSSGGKEMPCRDDGKEKALQPCGGSAFVDRSVRFQAARKFTAVL
jgi:hypothetical protein